MDGCRTCKLCKRSLCCLPSISGKTQTREEAGKWGTVWYCSSRLLHPSDEPLNSYTKSSENKKSQTRGPIRSPYLLGETQTGITVACSGGGGTQAAFTLRRKNLFAPLLSCSVGLLFKFFSWGIRPQLYSHNAHAEEPGWHNSLGTKYSAINFSEGIVNLGRLNFCWICVAVN